MLQSSLLKGWVHTIGSEPPYQRYFFACGGWRKRIAGIKGMCASKDARAVQALINVFKTDIHDSSADPDRAIAECEEKYSNNR